MTGLSSRRRKLAVRLCYFGGIILWVGYGLLIPLWAGRSYSVGFSPFHPPIVTHRMGGFGLRDSLGMLKRAPLWSPPSPHSPNIQAAVRWPWQPPSESNHVEIAVVATLARCTIGIIVMGFVLCGWRRISPPEKPDPLASYAWSLAVSLVIAWLTVIAFWAISLGMGTTDVAVCVILSLGGLFGLAFGAVGHSRLRHQQRPPADSGSKQTERQPAPSSDSSTAIRYWISRILRTLLAFATVCVAGALTMLVCSILSLMAPGGRETYGYGHKPPDYAAFLSLLTTGSVIALLGRWFLQRLYAPAASERVLFPRYSFETPRIGLKQMFLLTSAVAALAASWYGVTQTSDYRHRILWALFTLALPAIALLTLEVRTRVLARKKPTSGPSV